MRDPAACFKGKVLGKAFHRKVVIRSRKVQTPYSALTTHFSIHATQSLLYIVQVTSLACLD